MVKTKRAKKGAEAVADKAHLAKTIAITCTGAATMPLRKIVPLQGILKELSEENYTRLLALMVKIGFAFPVVMVKLKGKMHGTTDGHQRVAVLCKALTKGYVLVDSQGKPTDKIPVVIQTARSKKEVGELILAAISQFGKVTDDGLYAFMDGAGIGFEELAGYELPDFDTEAFTEWYAGEGARGKGPAEFGKVDETIDTKHTCPKCGYKWSGGK